VIKVLFDKTRGKQISRRFWVRPYIDRDPGYYFYGFEIILFGFGTLIGWENIQ